MAQVAAEVVDALAAPRRHAEGLGQAHEVGVGEVDPEVLAELVVLLPDDRAELAVLPDDVDERRLQAHRRLELLAVHEEAAVAVDRDHLALGVHELGGHRAGQREAHACKTVCNEDGVRLMRREHAADPQLVQPHVRDQDVLAPERLADLPQRPRGLHREGVVVLGLLEAPEHDVAQALRPAGVRDVAALLGQPREHVVDVADQLDLGREVLVDLGRLGVDDDDLLVAPRVPVRGGVLDEVVADGDDHVGVLEAGHGVVARVQPDGAQRLGVGVVEQPLAHEGLGHGDAGRAAELAQGGRAAGAHDAVAGQGHRVDGVADEVDGLEQLAGRGLGLDRPAAGQRRGVDLGAAMTSSGSSR